MGRGSGGVHRFGAGRRSAADAGAPEGSGTGEFRCFGNIEKEPGNSGRRCGQPLSTDGNVAWPIYFIRSTEHGIANLSRPRHRQLELLQEEIGENDEKGVRTEPNELPMTLIQSARRGALRL